MHRKNQTLAEYRRLWREIYATTWRCVSLASAAHWLQKNGGIARGDADKFTYRRVMLEP